MQLHITGAEKTEEKQSPRSREGLIFPVHKFYLQDFKSGGQLWFFVCWGFLWCCFALVFLKCEGRSVGHPE